MIPQEHRIVAALDPVGFMAVPSRVSSRWYRMAERRHDAAIQQALSDAGLPRLTSDGRKVFHKPIGVGGYFDGEQARGRGDSGAHWSRLWCRALGLPHRSAWDRDVIVDPTTGERSVMTAHERIQLLREEQAVAKNLAGTRRSPTPRTDIPFETPGVEP